MKTHKFKLRKQKDQTAKKKWFSRKQKRLELIYNAPLAPVPVSINKEQLHCLTEPYETGYGGEHDRNELSYVGNLGTFIGLISFDQICNQKPQNLKIWRQWNGVVTSLVNRNMKRLSLSKDQTQKDVLK
eukprot:TRINITY_DN861_c0_g1_i9.p2 TRINITY_DN861_c0_g1~~TRINITY_DN861_c0_g1_i9.p2  ORF type:complete len:129 (+),score=4.16 TRINITY_DN861_c0_g1_i9:253-639(+)